MLEIGCGTGAIARELAALPAVREVVGSDPSPLLVLHTVLSHVPQPERVLGEAFRVLRPDGRLAVFDGDYATITFAAGGFDPLECCADAFRSAYINDPLLVRRLPALVTEAGFTGADLRGHSYVQTADVDYRPRHDDASPPARSSGISPTPV